ncbi:uncharacterized protein LOC143353252 isoform X2 [Halictus rubicundus]|uniref:uncharacterized protein LOC143353252 isoform X2 n=1 Tax=Halictus rubicundus TaxID=77578 RepID=UPI0040357830
MAAFDDHRHYWLMRVLDEDCDLSEIVARECSIVRRSRANRDRVQCPLRNRSSSIAGMWKLPLLWKEQGRRLSVRWITGAELGRRTSSSIRWGGRRPR